MGNKLNLAVKKLPYGANEIFYIVVIFGFLLSGLSSFVLFNNEIDRKFSELSLKAQFDNNEMKGNLDNTIEAVRSITALYGASDHVDRMDFEKFASVEMVAQSNIQALSWAPRVSFTERKQFEATIRDDGLVNFSVVEKSKAGVMVNADRRDEYYPVHYIYPTKGNEAAIGFDLASSPSRLATLNKARDTGELQLTPRLTLVQEAGNSFGALAVLPIYKDIYIPKTIAERRDEIRGFATGVLRISDILSTRSNGTDYKSYVFDL
ncbi:MAG: CHASE1-domain containing sensor protein, partial [Gammaproteobacteria bacterium]